MCWGECGRSVCGCDCVGVGVIVWVSVGVIAWARECVGGTVLISAVKYVCVLGGMGGFMWVRLCGCGCYCVGGCGCDCVGVEGSVWVVQS